MFPASSVEDSLLPCDGEDAFCFAPQTLLSSPTSIRECKRMFDNIIGKLGGLEAIAAQIGVTDIVCSYPGSSFEEVSALTAKIEAFGLKMSV